MLGALIDHFETGSLRSHIKYSELWVKDIDPPVEHYYGFIETLRDPAGVRAEFESIVAVLDVEESKFLHKLVASSPTIVPLLPYPPCYERTNFSPPSYNAINLVAFCSTCNWIAINIPNYDEVRFKIGFKNVSLTNSLNAVPPSAKKFVFLPEELIPDFIRLYPSARALTSHLHELYGHGSGTLFKAEDVVGKQISDLLNPGKFVETFYAEGETFQTVFGSCGGAFEECRAETTALHLTYKEEVLEMYGVAPENRLNFKVVSTLGMLHVAVASLMCFIPETKKWTQAHSRGRFGIVQAVLRWGDGVLAVRKIGDRFKLFLDVAKFAKVEEAIARLLTHLNFYKAARLPEEGDRWFTELTSLDDFWLEVRQQAIALRTPRWIATGAVIRKVGDGYALERCGGETLTVLDAALSIHESVKLASE
jgi:dipeptidyl-peptidase-3